MHLTAEPVHPVWSTQSSQELITRLGLMQSLPVSSGFTFAQCRCSRFSPTNGAAGRLLTQRKISSFFDVFELHGVPLALEFIRTLLAARIL